jgi:uncharacterized DUF497 family protein
MGYTDDVVFGRFVWQQCKNEDNLRKHHFTFEDVLGVFSDEFRLEEYDKKNSLHDEDRYNTIGYVDKLAFVFVTTTDRDGLIRIISARKAEAIEKRRYDENFKRLWGL